MNYLTDFNPQILQTPFSPFDFQESGKQKRLSDEDQLIAQFSKQLKISNQNDVPVPDWHVAKRKVKVFADELDDTDENLVSASKRLKSTPEEEQEIMLKKRVHTVDLEDSDDETHKHHDKSLKVANRSDEASFEFAVDAPTEKEVEELGLILKALDAIHQIKNTSLEKIVSLLSTPDSYGNKIIFNSRVFNALINKLTTFKSFDHQKIIAIFSITLKEDQPLLFNQKHFLLASPFLEHLIQVDRQLLFDVVSLPDGDGNTIFRSYSVRLYVPDLIKNIAVSCPDQFLDYISTPGRHGESLLTSYLFFDVLLEAITRIAYENVQFVLDAFCLISKANAKSLAKEHIAVPIIDCLKILSVNQMGLVEQILNQHFDDHVSLIAIPGFVSQASSHLKSSQSLVSLSKAKMAAPIPELKPVIKGLSESSMVNFFPN